jgi:hypothetical protein
LAIQTTNLLQFSSIYQSWLLCWMENQIWPKYSENILILTIEKLKLLFVIVNKYKKTNLFKKKKKIVLLDFWDKCKISHVVGLNYK